MVRSRPEDLGTVVYRAIREEIVLGQLAPNQLISETELAAKLQVSRTPIREALQRLAAEGFIKSEKRRWIVYQHTLEEIAEIYEVRSALEAYAARLAAIRGSSKMLEELEQQVHNRPLSLDQGDDVMVTTNNLLHSTVAEASGNGRLRDLVEESRRYYFNSQVAILYREADIRESQAQHVALLVALKSRDPDAAEAVVRHHVDHALGIIQARLSTAPSHMPGATSISPSQQNR